MYDPSKTKILQQAEINNIPFANGLEMNLLQAAKAFKLASKSKFDESHIIEMMTTKVN